MARQQFTVSTQEQAEQERIEFSLHGKYARGEDGASLAHDGADDWTLDLDATPVPPLSAMDALRNAVWTDPVTRRAVYNPGSVLDFVRSCLMPEHRLRFDALVQDQIRLVDVRHLVDIMNWLSGQYQVGPTGALSSSTSGGAHTGSGAPADSSGTGLPAV